MPSSCAWHSGNVVAHRVERLGGADAGDDVLALRVGEEVAVGPVLAGRGVAGERDAGAGVVALVAEHHRLHVHRGAEVVGDLLHRGGRCARGRRSTTEHRLDRVTQLLLRVLRELDARLREHDRLEPARPAPAGPRPTARDRWRRRAASRSSSSACSNFSPSMSSTILPNICTNRRYESYAKRSLPVCCASPPTDTSFSPRLRTVSIIPGIENAAPERTDTSSGSVGIAEPLAHLRFERGAAPPATSSMRPVGHRVARGHVGVARVGRDREAGRHGQAELRHLGEVGALAAQQVLLLLRALLEGEHVPHANSSPTRSRCYWALATTSVRGELVVDALAVRVAVAPQRRCRGRAAGRASGSRARGRSASTKRANDAVPPDRRAVDAHDLDLASAHAERVPGERGRRARGTAARARARPRYAPYCVPRMSLPSLSACFWIASALCFTRRPSFWTSLAPC